MKNKRNNLSKESGIIALSDGTCFEGEIFGAKIYEKPVTGEAVFNTSMFGYQEILTDPSYAGQVMCFTAPHIGNVGCNEDDNESDRVHVEGIVVRDLSQVVSNYRATQSLEEYLVNAGVSGVTGVNTRELVTHLRDHGAKMCAIGPKENFSKDDLVDIARSAPSMEGTDYVKAVASEKAYSWSEGAWKNGQYQKISNTTLLSRPHVVAMDCGIKRNILRLLVDVGFRVTVVPAGFTAKEILDLKPDGLFLSNGPGDPATLDYIVNPVKELLGKVPMFGICLGHQILGQALGGKTYKLKFGHRGGNHPVMDYTTNKVEITVQNHGFAVDKNSLPSKVSITHINLNDNTVEGLEVKELNIFGVQYHPEASPGPHDSNYLFKRFFNNVVRRRTSTSI